VRVLELDVVARHVGEARKFRCGQVAHAPRRAAQVQAAALEALAGRDDAAGADHDLVLDHRAVEHDRADADQAAVADRAGVHHGLVTDRDLLADQQG
jgi:hypothetical protein